MFPMTYIGRSVGHNGIRPKLRESVIVMNAYMACFNVAGIAAFSWKRERIEYIPGDVSSAQSFCLFLKNDFHAIQSSRVHASKHFFTK